MCVKMEARAKSEPTYKTKHRLSPAEVSRIIRERATQLDAWRGGKEGRGAPPRVELLESVDDPVKIAMLEFCARVIPVMLEVKDLGFVDVNPLIGDDHTTDMNADELEKMCLDYQHAPVARRM